MLTACVLLTVLGVLGAFDIAWFHSYKARLVTRPESRREVEVHIARGFVYAAQFALVPNVRFGGAWYAVFVALFVLDVAIAALDVLLEPRSRCGLGGLPPGEYFMHVVLSVLAGAYLHALAADTAAWRTLPTAIAIEPHAPLFLRFLLLLMAGASLCVAVFETLGLVIAKHPARPIHVAVALRTTKQALWDLTQDHHVHPDWDHRFSRIVMHGDAIRTGTTMTYEKTILGMTIRGWGRYKLHKPSAQSTFEFGSDDARSLIRRGVGLWLYRDRGDGTVAFSTSYTYEVRWGTAGQILDRLLFRPLFQRETERSFRRLAERYFPHGASHVTGAHGRKPVPLEGPAIRVSA